MVPLGGTFKQIGVVSFGLGCAFPTQYGVYSEVGSDPLRSWVQDTTAAMSSAGSATPTDAATTTDAGATSDAGATTDAGTTSEPSAGGDSTTPAPGPSSGGAQESEPPRTALPATIGSLREARRRGAFLLPVRFNTPVTVTASLRRGGRLLARGTRRAVRHGTVRLRLTQRARNVRHGRAVLSIVVIDERGRRSTARRRVTIRR
jgi:hypothetical protein